MNLNGKQIISILIAVLGVLMVSTTQLTDLFGAGVAKTVVSMAALLNTTLGSVMAVISSTAQQVKDVSNTVGVEPIRINPQANRTLASLAVDPTISNVGPTEHEYQAVEAKASGAAS
jgi:hypothetical protein